MRKESLLHLAPAALLTAVLIWSQSGTAWANTPPPPNQPAKDIGNRQGKPGNIITKPEPLKQAGCILAQAGTI